jgi:Protein of unknown function with PCYCGC motif
MKHALTMGWLFVIVLAVSAPWATSQQEQDETRVPAFNPGPPAKNAKLPPILAKDQLWGSNAEDPFQTHAYELASKIPAVLNQQPCYCYCDRMGHKSLHSCFENVHGAQCATCLKELYYSYAQTKKGKTAKQIRQAIIAGEWKQLDLQSAALMN